MSGFPDAADVDVLIATLRAWVERGFSSVRVCLDVGGTNGRIGFEGYNPQDAAAGPLRIRLKLTGILGANDLVARLRDIATRIPPGVLVSCGCMGVAGPAPVDDNPNVRISNWAEGDRIFRYFGEEDPELPPCLPSALFPAGRSWVLNDMEACAWAFIAIGRAGDFHTFCHPRDFFAPDEAEEEEEEEEEGEGESQKKKKKYDLPANLGPHDYLILNMGTGLGCGYIENVSNIPGVPKTTYHPVPLEGGHMQPPMYPGDVDEKFQALITGWLRVAYPDGLTLNEVEDVLSGNAGITNVFYAMKKLGLLGEPKCEFDLPSEEYVPNSIKGHPLVKNLLLAHPEVALHQWRLLFFFARQIATLHKTVKALLLCGNNAARPVVQELLFGNRALLRDTFKRPDARAPWVQDVRCYLVVSLPNETRHINYNLSGASEYMSMQMDALSSEEMVPASECQCLPIKKCLLPTLVGIGIGLGAALLHHKFCNCDCSKDD